MSYLLPHLHTGYAVDRAIVEVCFARRSGTLLRMLVMSSTFSELRWKQLHPMASCALSIGLQSSWMLVGHPNPATVQTAVH